jgi:hypothetical protein
MRGPRSRLWSLSLSETLSSWRHCLRIQVRAVLKSHTEYGQLSSLSCPVWQLLSEQVGPLVPSENVAVVIDNRTTSSLQRDYNLRLPLWLEFE